MHSPKKKASRGVCGVCGRPVAAVPYNYRSMGYTHEGVDGHTYDKRGKLVSVRCPEHHDGLQPNSRALNAAPSEEDLKLLAAIRKGTT